MRRPLKSLLLAPAAAALLALAACTPAPVGQDGAGTAPASATQQATAASILSAAGVKDAASLAPEEMVAALEATKVAARPAGLTASITPEGMQLGAADGASASVPLDRFYLSVAPFATTTHECTYHAPVGCRGELSSAPIDVLIKDAKTGEELVKTSTTTADNGFAGFWLPRDRTVTVSITTGGKTGTVTTGTGADDPTCLTTLRVA